MMFLGLRVGIRNFQGMEPLIVDRAVEETGRLDAGRPRSRQERRGLPVSGRDLVGQSAPAQAPAVEAGHVRLGPGVDRPFVLL